jgi:hypothetical protein
MLGQAQGLAQERLPLWRLEAEQLRILAKSQMRALRSQKLNNLKYVYED